MNNNRADAFCALSEGQQILCLARLMCELSILGRSFYEGDGVSDPFALRQVNELQHKVANALDHLLWRRTTRYPDPVLVGIFFDLAAFGRFEEEFGQAFSDSIATAGRAEYIPGQPREENG